MHSLILYVCPFFKINKFYMGNDDNTIFFQPIQLYQSKTLTLSLLHMDETLKLVWN